MTLFCRHKLSEISPSTDTIKNECNASNFEADSSKKLKPGVKVAEMHAVDENIDAVLSIIDRRGFEAYLLVSLEQLGSKSPGSPFGSKTSRVNVTQLYAVDPVAMIFTAFPAFEERLGKSVKIATIVSLKTIG